MGGEAIPAATIITWFVGVLIAVHKDPKGRADDRKRGEVEYVMFRFRQAVLARWS